MKVAELKKMFEESPTQKHMDFITEKSIEFLIDGIIKETKEFEDRKYANVMGVIRDLYKLVSESDDDSFSKYFMYYSDERHLKFKSDDCEVDFWESDFIIKKNGVSLRFPVTTVMKYLKKSIVARIDYIDNLRYTSNKIEEFFKIWNS